MLAFNWLSRARGQHPRPGQAVFNGKLDDKLEAEMLEHIANGCTWTDASRLVGIRRESCINWRNWGAEYLEHPEENPLDARYGLFVQRIEEAELRCKASLIKKIIQCDDWRAWRFYLINRGGGDWKSEHIKSEISGPDGQAIPISLSPFRVEFVVPPQDPKEHFSVIDHSDNRLEDPSAGYIKPKE